MKLNRWLAITAAVGCALVAADGAPNERSGNLRLECHESHLTVSSGPTIRARVQAADLFAILYSDASDIWAAQTWRELKPDAVDLRRTRGGTSVRIRSFGGQPVELQAVAEVRRDRGEIAWHIRVRNGAPGTVVAVSGPALTGIETGPDSALYIPNRPGHFIPDPWAKLAGAPDRVAYPVPASMQYMVCANGSDGLAYHVRDSKMVYKELVFGGPQREFSVTQYAFIPPAGKWQPPEVAWQCLAGDWHLAADRYREWFRSWARVPPVSPQVRAYPIMGGTLIKSRPVDDLNVHDVMKSQEVGTYAAGFEQVKQLKAAGYGGTHLVGWFGRGHDTTYPDYDPSADMGGVAGLKALIDGIHSLGMVTTLYLNARVANVTNPAFLAHPEWRALLANGQTRTEGYGDQSFTLLCPASRGFQQYLLGQVMRVARDYRGDGVQLDQVGAAISVICFDRSHGHTTPATAWAEGYAEMLATFTREARRVNPVFWTWIEGAWEGAGQYVDLSQGGFWGDVPGSTYFPQMYRYTLPEHPMFGDSSMGAIPFWCPTDIHRAARINCAVKDVFIKGEFRDNVGLTTEPAARAHWFRDGKRIVVSVANEGDQDREFTVRLRWEWKLPAEGKALAADQTVAVRGENGRLAFTVKVPARQVETVLVSGD